MRTPPKILLLGSPGSGKSFYGKMISKKFDVPFVSMGKVLKERMPEDVKEAMAEGKLAPVEAVNEVYLGMKEEFSRGFVLDGFPRSLEQVEIFESAARDIPELNPSYALHFVLLKEFIIRKLLGRRECTSCGANWNLEHIEEGSYYMPAILPPSPTMCTCGASLHPRVDDNLETITSRLDTHQENWATLEPRLRKVLPVHDIEITSGSETMWPLLIDKIETLRSC